MNTLHQLLCCIVSNQELLNSMVLQFKNHGSLLAVSLPSRSTAHNNKLQVVLYAHKVAEITGFKIRTARKMLRQVRERLGKPPRSLVTVKEFLVATNMPLQDILPYVKTARYYCALPLCRAQLLHRAYQIVILI